MSFLWGNSAQSEFDTLLEKITSDLLPSSTPPDLFECLQLADMIRSSQIPAAAAAKSLLRRLKHANPNVQLLTLGTLDICVKNGGIAFLKEVSDRPFSAEFETLANSSNVDVRERAVALLQNWAVAFQGTADLRNSELVRLYNVLKLQYGVEFPALDASATSTMIESLAAPEWKDAPYCARCRTEFTTFNRKHHCRNCGDIFDNACSSHTMPLPRYGITYPVRVCDGCFRRLKPAEADTKYTGSKAEGAADRKHTRKMTREEHDLQRAIQASLATAAPQERRSELPDEDDDLKRAIEASLRDAAQQHAPSAPPDFDEEPALTYSDLYPAAPGVPQNVAQGAGVRAPDAHQQLLSQMNESLSKAAELYEQLMREQRAQAQAQAQAPYSAYPTQFAPPQFAPPQFAPQQSYGQQVQYAPRETHPYQTQEAAAPYRAPPQPQHLPQSQPQPYQPPAPAPPQASAPYQPHTYQSTPALNSSYASLDLSHALSAQAPRPVNPALIPGQPLPQTATSPSVTSPPVTSPQPQVVSPPPVHTETHPPAVPAASVAAPESAQSSDPVPSIQYSFPSAPSGPILPSVPQTEPAQQEEAPKVGALIEL